MRKKSYHTGQRRVVLPNDPHDVFIPPHLENDPLNEPDREALAVKKEAKRRRKARQAARLKKKRAHQKKGLGPAPPDRLHLYDSRRLRPLAVPAAGSRSFRDDHRRWQ